MADDNERRRVFDDRIGQQQRRGWRIIERDDDALDAILYWEQPPPKLLGPNVSPELEMPQRTWRYVCLANNGNLDGQNYPTHVTLAAVRKSS